VSYADFVAWERRRLTIGVPHEDYWSSQLADVRPLPLNGAFDAWQPRGREQSVDVALAEGSAMRNLREFTRQAGSHMDAVIIAAFGCALALLTEREQMCIALAYDARGDAEMPSLLGQATLLRPLRLDLSGASTFGEMVGRVDASVAAASEHHGLPPLARLRLPDGVRLIQQMVNVSFSFHAEAASSSASFAAERHTPLAAARPFDVGDARRGASLFDLSFDVRETAERLAVRLSYDALRMEAVQARSLLRDVRELLERGTPAPTMALGSLKARRAAEIRTPNRLASNAQLERG
jgi:hypothetical protein